jgi:Kelch motif/Galactose oxidase, central domain
VRRALVALLATALAAGAAAGATAGEADTEDAVPMIGPGKTEVGGAYWARYGLIAVAGGFVESGASSRDLLLLDVDGDEWSRGPDLPGPRNHAALVALGGALYLVGGFTTGLDGATAEVWRLDDPDGDWVEVASMDTARGALGAVAVDGRLFAIGGVDESGRDLATTEWFDPEADAWAPGPDLARTRQHVGVAVRRGVVFAIGGRSPNLDSVERVRFRGGEPDAEWEAAPTLEFSRSGHGAATVGGTVCTAGGEEEAGTIAPIECLRDGSWEHVADMTVPRHGIAVVAVGDELHLVSGGPEPGFAFSVDHEVLQL